ncbi:MAG: mechanosensitive ion channel family protein [Bdellovibrionales bacterium]
MKKILRIIAYFLLSLTALLPALAVALDAAGLAQAYLPQEWVDILNTKWMNNTYSAWLQAVAIAVAAAAALILVDKLLEHRLDAVARPQQLKILSFLNRLAHHTSVLFLLILALDLGLARLALPENIDTVTDHVFSVVLFIQIGLWASEFISDAVVGLARRQERHNPAVRNALALIRMLTRGVVWALVLIAILDNLGFDITALVAGLGIGGAAVALASQNILSDLFSSLGLVLDKPFTVGDFIVLGNNMGTVENIGMKTTQIRSLSGEQLIIPNTDLLQARIHNYKRMQERRVVQRFGILYETPPEKVAAVPAMLRAAVEKHENARFDRAHFDKFGDSALEFELVYFILSAEFNTYMDIKQQINLDLLQQFADTGLQFAYPTQTLHVQKMQPA